MGMSETYPGSDNRDVAVGDRVYRGCRSGIVLGFMHVNSEVVAVVTNGEDGDRERKELWPTASIQRAE